MKQLIAPIAIIVALIAFFVIIDRKDFYPGGDVAVQKEDVTRKPTSVTTLKPVEQPKETKPIVADKLAPSVVPVVTAEEAEKLNAEAMIFAEKHAKRMFFASKGMELVYDDKMNTYTSVSIAESFDEKFKTNGVVKSRSELMTRKVPNGWAIDYSSLKGNCDFNRKDNTYEISSPDGVLKINTPARLVLNTATGISVELTGKTPETKVRLGIEELGMFRPGKTYVGELSGEFEEECINYEISALEHYDNVRPFLEITGDVTILGLRIYQKELTGTTYLEGEIVERSNLPDPKKSDYPNCRYTVQFAGNVIKGGVPCPKEMALIVDGFENYKTLRTDTLKKGDKIICSVIPYNTLSEEDQSIQQVDDLNLFTLENYYVLGARKISVFSDNATMPRSGIFFSGKNEEYVSIFERHINDSISPEVIEAQRISVQNDLTRMNSMIESYNEEKIKEINSRFEEAWNKEKQKDQAGYNRNGDYVWRNIDNSFWCLPMNYTLLSKPDLLTQDTLDAFASLKDACEANGVQLIVSLVPDLYVVSSRVINKDFRHIPDLQTATYVKQLSEIGVEAIYSTDAIIHNFNRFPFAFFFPENGHPSDTTQDVISDILVERLRRYDIMPVLDPHLFSEKQSPHVYGNAPKYWFPKDCDIGDNEVGKPYTCREILYDGEKIRRNPDAPIITLGNSYMQTPMGSPDSLSTLISMKLLSTVYFSRLQSFGPFTTVISRLLVEPEKYLKHKKVLVMQCGTTHLTNVNINSLMVNIRKADANSLLFGNHSSVFVCNELKPGGAVNSIDDSLWQDLPQKHVYQIDESGTINVADFSIESKVDNSKAVICVIPAVCFKAHSASFSVNGIKKDIPSFYIEPFYSFIAFELPPGTKTIEVSAEGKEGTAIAVKDIQIWQ